MSAKDTIRDYDHRAGELLEKYESVAFEKVHEAVLDLIPESSALVLDLGAGSGRDAAWLAAHGHDVVAVEPAYQLQQLARQRHRDAKIQWMADSLPDLHSLIRTGNTFDLIWLSAVWMHIRPGDERARVFRKLVTLLRPSGQITITLRKGPSALARIAHRFEKKWHRTLDSQGIVRVSGILIVFPSEKNFLWIQGASQVERDR